MSLRFASQLQVDLLPDEQTDNKFEVVMPRLSLNTDSDSILNTLGGAAKYCPLVEQIVFAPQNFNTKYTRLHTDYWGYPEDRTPAKNVTITMFLDAGNLAAYYIESWKKLIFNETYQYYYNPQNYKKNIAVIFYGLGGTTPSAVYYLKGCFPIETSAYQFAYSMSPKRLTLTTTFSVDRVEFDQSKAALAIAQTLLTGNPLGIVADQATAYANETIYGSDFVTE